MPRGVPKEKKGHVAQLTDLGIEMNELAWERLDEVVHAWGHEPTPEGRGRYLASFLTPPAAKSLKKEGPA